MRRSRSLFRRRRTPVLRAVAAIRRRQSCSEPSPLTATSSSGERSSTSSTTCSRSSSEGSVMDLITNVVQGSGSDRLLLLLHGYGADERDLGGLLSYLDPEGRFVTVLPRGPIAAPPGFSWFDMMGLSEQSDPEAALAQGFAD